MITWLEQHLFSCHFKAFAGFECPGCGSQRAFILLLKGDLQESVALAPALIPFLFTLFYTALHIAFKFRNGAKTIQWLFTATLAITMTAWGIKLYNLF